MKKLLFYCSTLLFYFGTAGCNGNGTTTSTDTTSKTQMNANDSAVTTTTTTTVVHHRYSGSFMPQSTVKYLDLKTNKQVTVRIDTTQGDIVNSETNEPIDLLVEPKTHDTIYGQTGTVVNNYITKDETGYRVDTVRIHTVDTVSAAPAAAPGREKIKEKKNKEKIKDKEY